MYMYYFVNAYDENQLKMFNSDVNLITQLRITLNSKNILYVQCVKQYIIKCVKQNMLY